MKKIKNSYRHLFACFLAFCLLLGCGQAAKDQSIKADLTVKAKEDVNFAGVHFSVEKGIVTLTGSCPTGKSIEMVKQKIKSIHVIDSIVDHLVIAPVTLGPSFNIKQQVDSVLAKYPAVIASVSDTAVVLTGKVKETERNKMVAAVGKIYPNVKSDQLVQEIK